MPKKTSKHITLIRPDDWHAHFRDGALLKLVLPITAERFARAIVMPNLDPPVTDVEACAAYAERIRAAIPPGAAFQALMTLFLCDDTTPEVIKRAKPDPEQYDFIFGVKLYPRGVTTHSQSGVKSYDKLAPVFAEMQERRLPLLVHGESPDPEVDFYDREVAFLERTLMPVREQFPELKIVLEHITSRDAIKFVRSFEHTGATITPHHLLYNRGALFEGGLRPHRYCLPPAKREEDRLALIEVACSGDERFFCGTDSAPHEEHRKTCDHGCAGIFNAPTALETYAEIFDANDALDKLEQFTSVNGARFYGVPLNDGETITLVKEEWSAPDNISSGDLNVVPFRNGEQLQWRLQ